MAAWLGENASQRWAEGLYAKAKAGFEMFWDEARGTYVDHIKDGVQQKPISQVAGRAGDCLRAGAAGALGAHRRDHHRPGEAGGALVDGRRERRVLAREDAEAVHGHLRGRLGHGAPDRDRRAVHQLPGARRGGGGRAGGQAARAVPALEPVPDRTATTPSASAGAGARTSTAGAARRPRTWSSTRWASRPAEPGYTAARIAPRLGRLAWAEGKVPTPHGLISVRAEPGLVSIDSPVPVIVDLPGQAPRSLPKGKHKIV